MIDTPLPDITEIVALKVEELGVAMTDNGSIVLLIKPPEEELKGYRLTTVIAKVLRDILDEHLGHLTNPRGDMH